MKVKLYIVKLLLLIFYNLFTLFTAAQKGNNFIEKQLNEKSVLLPNGWSLSPAGRSLPLGDLPLNLAVSKSGRYLAVTNNGQSIQSIQLIDPKTEKVLHNIIIPKSWYGLKFSADDKFLYASGGNDNLILQYVIVNNKLLLKDSIVLGRKWPEKISPAGIDIDDNAKMMYVVTKGNNSLYVINIANKSIIQQLELGKEAYTCLLSPDKKELYISSWGGDKVQIYSTQQRKIIDEIAVGDNPNELLLNKKGNYLFVANANDNSVSVIDITSRKTVEILNVALYPDAPSGSTTNGLALSADEKKLYIANADNNCLAVFDVTEPGRSKSKGFIPVGWYPTNIKVVDKKIFVSNGKGYSSFANPEGPNPFKKTKMELLQFSDTAVGIRAGYTGSLMKGTLSIIDEPSEAILSVYSQAVYRNSPYSKEKEMNAEGEKGNPIPMKVGDLSPIKYVFYIIKENRTYDQVLGDMPEGNGDTTLVLFGDRITPNQHSIARQFVLLDNFYVDGEVSTDGHNWSMGAYATDYLEKNWPTSYGGRGGNESALGLQEIANNKGGFIWDHCKKAGVSYRTYGEFVVKGKGTLPSLTPDHICGGYDAFNASVRDTTRFYKWQRDFDSLLAVNALPRFNTIRMSNNHTEGLRLGRPTPFAHVADNDLAVGLLVEHLSKSKVWKESAVFIVEDDAQNGPDHVDAHRTTAFLASPFAKSGFVDHTMYSTSSMLRTMELILGLKPMSQFDAGATPMFKSFTSKPNFTPFKSVPSNIDFNDKNTATNATARLSDLIDLSQEDRVPDMLFSQIIWKAVKGEQSEMPAPHRSAFLKITNDGDDDESEISKIK